jgi:hypothetical protein
VSTAGKVLRAFARVMSGRRERWYVFGAQAAIAYGLPRSTADVDITIEAPDAQALVGALQKGGFTPRFPDDVEIARVIPLVHRATKMPLDLVLAGPGLEQEFLDRARPIDFDGVRVPAMSVEDLVVSKVLAGRPKDLDDVRNVLAVQVDVDVGYIRAVLGDLEDALGQSDLLPTFERALATRPKPKQPKSKAKPKSKPRSRTIRRRG